MKSMEKRFEFVYQRILDELQKARVQVVRSINTAMVQSYWKIGREIVEEELQGKQRADYGDALIHKLSERLTADFGRGFTVTNLKYMRLFFLKYQNRGIGHAVRDQLEQEPKFEQNLSWTHYRLLTKAGDG